MADTVYRTVEREAADEFVERRSRFIGSIRPVQTEEDALRFIQEKKKAHWDAAHNVSAYVLRAGGIRRYSDDGEPQGTAGMPVLEVLLREELTDCVVVVTRYFGGILLGAGGLVRAYAHSAKLAVDAGVRREMRLCDRLLVRCDYAQYGRVSPLILENGGVIDDTAYADDVAISFHLPRGLLAPLQEKLTDCSAGTLTAQEMGEEYYPFSVKS